MPTTIDIESQRMFLGSTPVRKIYRGTSLLGMRIAELFANGEQGVWYDPSDLSTLFQDAAGTTPVTAVEQPVGLMLDKSKGLVMGPELVTNGGPFTATNGWSGTNVTLSVENGRLKATSNASGYTAVIFLNASGVFNRVKASYFLQPPTGKGVNVVVRHTFSRIVNQTGSYTDHPIPSGANTESIAFTWTASVAGEVAYFDNISVREIPGSHAYQTTATSRPVLRQDGNGKHYLYFDGVDDGLVTNTITPGTDKVQVFAGVRKLSDAAQGVVAELSATIASNNGTFLLAAPDGATQTYGWDSKGTTQVDAVATSIAAPITSVVTGLADISGDSAIIRVNGAVADTEAGDQGTGNFLAYPLYIGRRGGTSFPFNGHLYSLIVRFGSNLPIAMIEKTEKYINQKTRAY